MRVSGHRQWAGVRGVQGLAYVGVERYLGVTGQNP